MIQVSGNLHGLKHKQQYYHSHLSVERWTQSGLKSQVQDAARRAGFRGWRHSPAHHHRKYPVKERRGKRKASKPSSVLFHPVPQATLAPGSEHTAQRWNLLRERPASAGPLGLMAPCHPYHRVTLEP